MPRLRPEAPTAESEGHQGGQESGGSDTQHATNSTGRERDPKEDHRFGEGAGPFQLSLQITESPADPVWDGQARQSCSTQVRLWYF